MINFLVLQVQVGETFCHVRVGFRVHFKQNFLARVAYNRIIGTLIKTLFQIRLNKKNYKLKTYKR